MAPWVRAVSSMMKVMAWGTSPSTWSASQEWISGAVSPLSRPRRTDASEMRHTLARPGDSRSAMRSMNPAIAGSSGPGASTVMSAWAINVSTEAGTSVAVAAATSSPLIRASVGVDCAWLASAPTNSASRTTAAMRLSENPDDSSGAWKSILSMSPAWRSMVRRAWRSAGAWASSLSNFAPVSTRHGEATQPASTIAH